MSAYYRGQLSGCWVVASWPCQACAVGRSRQAVDLGRLAYGEARHGTFIAVLKTTKIRFPGTPAACRNTSRERRGGAYVRTNKLGALNRPLNRLRKGGRILCSRSLCESRHCDSRCDKLILFKLSSFALSTSTCSSEAGSLRTPTSAASVLPLVTILAKRRGRLQTSSVSSLFVKGLPDVVSAGKRKEEVTTAFRAKGAPRKGPLLIDNGMGPTRSES